METREKLVRELKKIKNWEEGQKDLFGRKLDEFHLSQQQGWREVFMRKPIYTRDFNREIKLVIYCIMSMLRVQCK